MRSRTLTTLTAILLAFAPAAADHAAATGKTDKAAADQDATQPRTSITVATAGAIVGKPVRDKDYKALGEVEFPMADPKTGGVLYLALGSAGGFDL